MVNVRDLLAADVVLCDGAMGTLLDVGYGKFGLCKEQLNLSDANLIQLVHRSYLEAGARLLHTNSFGANALKLEMYGLEDKVRPINEAAARLACKTAGSLATVSGSVGPLGFRRFEENLTDDDILQIFTEQVEGLAEGGAAMVSLETFLDLREMVLAIRAVKRVLGVPPICMFRGFPDGKLGNERDTGSVLRTLRNHGVEVLGVNCNAPYYLKEALEDIAESGFFDLIAQPNAGPPEEVQGRVHYHATPDYVAEYAREYAALGARLIGGCCGTTPEHIRAMSEALKTVTPGPRPQRPAKTARLLVEVEEQAAAAQPASRFLGALAQRFAITVELRPPKGAEVGPYLEAAAELGEAGADAINVTDNSLGNLTVCSLVLASQVQRQTGLPAIMHYTCRHRNLLAMQSDLLGAAALGIDTVLALTGDHPSGGDNPDAVAVHNLSSTGLIGLITSRLNRGVDHHGNPLAQPTRFAVGCALNPNLNLKYQVDYLAQKIAAGARFCLTQPIYDEEVLEAMRGETQGVAIPILPGILPLRSLRNARFLRDNVPGLRITDAIMQRLAAARTPEEERRTGLAMARSLYERIRQRSPGVYLIAPFGNHKVIREILAG